MGILTKRAGSSGSVSGSSSGDSPPAMAFASFPAASSVSGQRLRASDLANAVFASDGTRWRPEGGRQIIAPVVGQPIYIAPTGSVAANGALTLGTALLSAQKCWMYLPAGAAYAGSTANFYYVDLSTTLLGTVYNNIYTPTLRNWDFPTSPTPIVDAGPGAYTGVIAQVTAIDIAIPANLMGPSGQLSAYNRQLYTNSAGSKTLRHKLGGTIFAQKASTTSAIVGFTASVGNLGVTDAQIASNVGDTGTVTNGVNLPVINTTAATNLVYTLEHAVDTDWIGLVGTYLELIA